MEAHLKHGNIIYKLIGIKEVKTMSLNRSYYYTGTWNTWSTATDNWSYIGSGNYETEHEGYIKVDKGSPDKAQFVIFYAVKEKDPMIFCKTRKEVEKEIQKLMKREEVDKKSIRVFTFSGGIKVF